MGRIKKSSTNNINRQYIHECDLIYAVCKIGGRWKLLILDKLKVEKLRFSELRKSISGITERMFTLQLRELEKEGLVKRTVYALIPLRVDNELTEMVRELIPIWKLLSECGGKHSDLIQISEALEEKSF